MSCKAHFKDGQARDGGTFWLPCPPFQGLVGEIWGQREATDIGVKLEASRSSTSLLLGGCPHQRWRSSIEIGTTAGSTALDIGLSRIDPFHGKADSKLILSSIMLGEYLGRCNCERFGCCFGEQRSHGPSAEGPSSKVLWSSNKSCCKRHLLGLLAQWGQGDSFDSVLGSEGLIGFQKDRKGAETFLLPAFPPGTVSTKGSLHSGQLPIVVRARGKPPGQYRPLFPIKGFRAQSPPGERLTQGTL